MPVTDTPLRYPGGKSQLTPLIVDILKQNDLVYGEYAEPFAGGAGIAMSLLLNDYVSKVYLNDIDPAIYAFWVSVLDHTDLLCERIDRIPVTIDEWHRQREVFLDIPRWGDWWFDAERELQARLSIQSTRFNTKDTANSWLS